MELVRKLSGWVGWRWLAGIGLCAILIWWMGPRLWSLSQDQQAFQQVLARFGWLGPLALIVFNALQIVAAPIPGYVVQAAAGYLYGPYWGGLWGSLGLISGALLAMWLARTLGRRWVEQWAGAERLAHWEQMTHSNSNLVWLVLLAAPIGDLPYFLAGLARVGYGQILLLTLVVRVPATFVVASVGAGAVQLSWTGLGLIIGGLGVLLLLYLRYQAVLLCWMDETVQRRLPSRGTGSRNEKAAGSIRPAPEK
jgi:uncharacterized membrane protein YdjX (TVP38/TMEM64 family)